MLPEVWQATHKVAAQPRLAGRKKGLVSEVVLACRGPDLRKRQPPSPAFRLCCERPQQHPVRLPCSSAVDRWVNVGSAPPLLRPVSMDTHTSPTHQSRRRAPSADPVQPPFTTPQSPHRPPPGKRVGVLECLLPGQPCSSVLCSPVLRLIW